MFKTIRNLVVVGIFGVALAVGFDALTSKTNAVDTGFTPNPPRSSGTTLGEPVHSAFSFITNGPFAVATNSSLIVRPGTQTNLPVFDITAGRNLIGFPWFFGSNSVTLSNLVFKLEVCPLTKGAPFTTTTITSFTFTATGTTPVVGRFVVPSSLLDGAYLGRWSVTNTSVTNSMTISNFFGVFTP
jgi:hypothetical protein